VIHGLRTSHDGESVERLCTDVGIIVKGELVEQSSLAHNSPGRLMEERFSSKRGCRSEATRKLNWLEEAASVELASRWGLSYGCGGGSWSTSASKAGAVHVAPHGYYVTVGARLVLTGYPFSLAR